MSTVYDEDVLRRDREFVQLRSNWGRYNPKRIRGITMNRTLKNSLEGDIWDTYRALVVRPMDVLVKKRDASRMGPAFMDRVFLRMTKSFPFRMSPAIPFRVRGFHTAHFAAICNRNTRNLSLFLDIVPIDENHTFPTELTQRQVMERDYYMVVLGLLRAGPERRTWRVEKDVDTIRIFPEDMSSVINIGFSFNGAVPHVVTSGMHFLACCQFCPHLEPLLYFWHSLMCEEWTEYGTRRIYRRKWFHIEKTALLVIFFLQRLRLIPMIMRETDVFIPSNVTWEKVKQWENGVPFFSKKYIEQKKREIEKSEHYGKSSAELFAMLLEFFVFTAPLGHCGFDFDRGIIIRVCRYPDYVPIRTRLTKFYDFEAAYGAKSLVHYRMLVRMREIIKQDLALTSPRNVLLEARFTTIREMWNLWTAPYPEPRNQNGAEDEEDEEEEKEEGIKDNRNKQWDEELQGEREFEEYDEQEYRQRFAGHLIDQSSTN